MESRRTEERVTSPRVVESLESLNPKNLASPIQRMESQRTVKEQSLESQLKFTKLLAKPRARVARAESQRMVPRVAPRVAPRMVPRVVPRVVPRTAPRTAPRVARAESLVLTRIPISLRSLAPRMESPRMGPRAVTRVESLRMVPRVVNQRMVPRVESLIPKRQQTS